MSCGLVLGDRVIDTRSEWRTFADDEAGYACLNAQAYISYMWRGYGLT